MSHSRFRHPVADAGAVAALALGLLGASACSGVVEAGGSAAMEGGSNGSGKGGSGVGSGSGSGSADGTVPPGAVEPGSVPLRRLTNHEYRNTLQDLLGLSEAEVAGVELVPDVSGGLFVTNTDVQSLTASHLDAYDAAARKLVGTVVGSEARRAKLVGCDLNADRNACTRQFLSAFGRRAYRRLLTMSELDTLLALAATESQGSEGVALALRAVLQAPHFLFKPESGTPDPDKPGLNKLTGFEVATRLSYLLLGRNPSDKLLALAENEGLDDPRVLSTLADELLDDARARPTFRRFLSQWLHLDKLPALERDKAKFPSWSEDLKRSMAEETTRFMEDLLWSEGASFLDYLDARYTFVDARLAKIYDVPAPAEGQWQRVSFDSSTPRAGVITQPSILALTGRQNGSSAIWRGVFVREHVLCESLPSPPANVGEIKPPERGIPERQRLEQHRSDPACSGCHKLLDPVGFGLSGYDAVGAYRTSDEFGNPLDDSGELEGFDKPNFRGALELSARLKSSPQAQACVPDMLGQFLLGRGRVDEDEVLMGKLKQAFIDSGFRPRAVVTSFVQSDAFRYRRL